ncbi:MAG: hypothetical protein HQM08_07655 [Candidatus Riflebacteria bacterium]|nr:hypothetical protein [Candidatus Riflebacteria bacterium]
MSQFSKLKIESTGNGPVKLGFIGSVRDVLAAYLPKTLSNNTFFAKDYLYGFELASTMDKYSLGEALLVNGTCYSTSSDKTSPEYNNVIHGREFLTGGLFIFPHGVEPTHKATFKSNESTLTLMDLYTELYEKIKKPVAFAGIGECANFHATAIGKPPIDGKTIFDHKEEYFPNPEIKKNNVTVFVTGALTNYNDSDLSEINKQLEVVLYKNPFDSGAILSNHAHVLTLNQPIRKIEDISPDLVDGALHLLADGTNFSYLQADIYTISCLVNYQNE